MLVSKLVRKGSGLCIGSYSIVLVHGRCLSLENVCLGSPYELPVLQKIIDTLIHLHCLMIFYRERSECTNPDIYTSGHSTTE